MNKKIIIFLIVSLFMCLPLNVKAAYDATINENSVRIRRKAGTNYSILYTVNKGTEISVVDKTLHSGTGCSKKWYKITYKGTTGYVCSSYVSFKSSTFSGINVVDWTARVNANNVTVRKSATTKSDAVSTLTLGANVEILSSTTANNVGCSTNTWYKIKYYIDKTGYICSKYVTKKESIIKDDAEYAQLLREEGFSDSYIPYLSYLHSKYPNWTFKAKNTNSNFATAVDAEEGHNYMQTTNNNYRTSTVPAEGSSWFKVNQGVIAFYMDPRNWLTKERIFMFEKLDYAPSYEEIYLELVKSLFGDGALGADTYTVPMCTYGKQYKVSPLHIGSRIRLEVGKNGSHSTDGGEFTYKGKTYSGYYNFFNIGSYPQTIDGVGYSAITMGLVKAKSNGWDTVEKAIEGGVKFLANGYITKGQGTLYYQKFNVSPDSEPYSTKYLHQYMTNIQAPATEGNQNYNSYKEAEILTNPFIFEIPVYNNMPDYVSLPASGDSNNSLKSLSVTGYSIEPTFDEDVVNYEVFIPGNINKVTVNATAASNKATVSGAGEIETLDKTTIVTITVTSEVGEDNKYVLTINKNENTTPSGNDNQGENNSGNTNNDTTYKTIANILKDSGINVSNNNITSVKYNVKASTILNLIIKNGASNVVIKDKDNKVITDNTLIGTASTITITSGNETKTYTFVIKGDTSGDGKITILDLLQVQKHIKGDKKLTNSYLLASDTSLDGKVTILDLLQIQKHIKGDKKL